MHHLRIHLDGIDEYVIAWFEYEESEPEVNAPETLDVTDVDLAGISIIEILNKETIEEIEQKILSYKE